MVWWGGWAFKVTKAPPPSECHLSLGGQTPPPSKCRMGLGGLDPPP